MADLTDIFGSEIRVGFQPRQFDKQYVGFPGSKGVVGMSLGSRGRQLVINGRLRHAGESYAVARAALQADIDAIEDNYLDVEDDYTYKSDTYEHIVFDKLSLVPDGDGKFFHWDGSQCFVDFVCYGRQLI